MIRINGHIMNLGSFPDGTLLFDNADARVLTSENRRVFIDWYYDSDRELTALIFLTRHLRENGISNIWLNMPYIPNARQDRVKGPSDVFTLKYFAEIINSLNFTSVTVLDPHSGVSKALINNICALGPEKFVNDTLNEIVKDEGEQPIMFYPDMGASKRYSEMVGLPYAFGMKQRDWSTRKITGLEIAGGKEQIFGNNVLIVDDICSKGETLHVSAKKLKDAGAKNIYLYVSHCENTVLSSELIRSGLIKKIFTTDSIFTGTHPLIKVFYTGRGEIPSKNK